jgi:hypothetical protein
MTVPEMVTFDACTVHHFLKEGRDMVKKRRAIKDVFDDLVSMGKIIDRGFTCIELHDRIESMKLTLIYALERRAIDKAISARERQPPPMVEHNGHLDPVTL